MGEHKFHTPEQGFGIKDVTILFIKRNEIYSKYARKRIHWFMRIAVLLLTMIVSCLKMAAQTPTGYEYTIDLTQVVDDKVKVELLPPLITSSQISFHFPKIIPGTYAVQDYGRFVSQLEVRDKKGILMPAIKLDTNSWQINNASKIGKISYWIEDSFDTKLRGPVIFWPAGTNIEANKNIIINPAGFFGYFDEMKEVPLRVNVIRDEAFYGTTGLIPEKMGVSVPTIDHEVVRPQEKKTDTYQAENFDRLVDSPLMYAKADTAIIKVANTDVLIGVYSPNKKVTAREIAGSISKVLMAQKEYLGGTLPVEKYAFIFYFTDKMVMSFGALEHSYSSLYFMPERSIETMSRSLQDFASHEFFHIVTPLNIHSEEIGHFEFNNPKMSQHLWLYEGVTEYFSGNMQVKYELITPDQYLNDLREKMMMADQFTDALPFTELSKHILDKYEDQFYNVYQKGALIGLCLDIKLRQLSGGRYGLQNLVHDLSKKYGKDKAFQDDQLFSEIGKMTYPEIENFLNTYVAGPAPLPLPEIFKLVGVNYEKLVEDRSYNLGFGSGNITTVTYQNKTRFAFQNADRLSSQGVLLGIKDGDILLKINDELLPPDEDEAKVILGRHRTALAEGQKLSYTVMRKNEAGNFVQTRLEAPVTPVISRRRHVISFDPDATAAQLKLRREWLVPQ